jgi:hypothetical protein
MNKVEQLRLQKHCVFITQLHDALQLYYLAPSAASSDSSSGSSTAEQGTCHRQLLKGTPDPKPRLHGRPNQIQSLTLL